MFLIGTIPIEFFMGTNFKPRPFPWGIGDMGLKGFCQYSFACRYFQFENKSILQLTLQAVNLYLTKCTILPFGPKNLTWAKLKILPRTLFGPLGF